MDHNAQGELFEVVLALCLPSRLASRLHCRQQQGYQNPNDRDDDQKLYERKCQFGIWDWGFADSTTVCHRVSFHNSPDSTSLGTVHMDRDELRKRTKDFALRIIRLVAALPRNRMGDVLGRQVLKSGLNSIPNPKSQIPNQQIPHDLLSLPPCVSD
jgi:hypothetical protein